MVDCEHFFIKDLFQFSGMLRQPQISFSYPVSVRQNPANRKMNLYPVKNPVLSVPNMNNTVKDSELNQTIDSLGLFQTKCFRVLIVRCQTARVLRVELVYPVVGKIELSDWLVTYAVKLHEYSAWNLQFRRFY